MTSLITYFLITLLSLNISDNNNTDNNNKNTKAMKFELIKLPYATNALEPVISQQTIELHHGKHLQTYVNNLNNLVPGTKYENMDLVSIVKDSEGGVFNNAGQILNHEIYFTSFAPNAGGEPKGKLADAINTQWGSFENFKKEFNAAGAAVFGSGWVWLAKDASGKLSIEKEPNGSNPVVKGLTPILGFDVWEHAYYLDYQNRRADHLAELWKIINWDVVSARY
ncbi:superoxide dismutase, Fe-Mn family [Dysgonomonas macrotermitis]|uniref:Superoxide dismutase n=2 Tax=Dysgonomonas macrotermitis TaxID=1346286 RepID=A0A1M5AFJ5_9BACT|nr:superoxide dismutase, Fe-Mn family [Dysgonomonas macrotermitis]